MAATEGKRATVPCSTHEEDRCFEQERFGSRGKIPLLEICNILSRRTKHSPQFLCRKNAGKQSVQHPSSSADCVGLNFPHWVENSDQKAPPFLKLAWANCIHRQLTSFTQFAQAEATSCAQHPVAVVKFSIGKPGVCFLKCLHQLQLSPLEMYLQREQRRFLTPLLYSLWSNFYPEGGMCTVVFLMLWHPPVVVNWNTSPL